VLNLHWNKIKFRGGNKIAESLKTNETLRVLDLSWNLMGKWNPTFVGRITAADIKKRLKITSQLSPEEAFKLLND
jgi:hypothetical protein